MNYKKVLVSPLFLEPEQRKSTTTRKQLQSAREPFINLKRNLNKENQSGTINSSRCLSNRDVQKSIVQKQQKKCPSQDHLLKQYEINQAKIQKMSVKLDQLYTHYQAQKEVLKEMRERIPEKAVLKLQNQSIRSEISRIKEMLKEVLLTREKGELSSVVF